MRKISKNFSVYVLTRIKNLINNENVTAKSVTGTANLKLQKAHKTPLYKKRLFLCELTSHRIYRFMMAWLRNPFRVAGYLLAGFCRPQPSCHLLETANSSDSLITINKRLTI